MMVKVFVTQGEKYPFQSVYLPGDDFYDFNVEMESPGHELPESVIKAIASERLLFEQRQAWLLALSCGKKLPPIEMIAVPRVLLRKVVDSIETVHCNEDGDEYNIDENCEIQRQVEILLQ